MLKTRQPIARPPLSSQTTCVSCGYCEAKPEHTMELSLKISDRTSSVHEALSLRMAPGLVGGVFCPHCGKNVYVEKRQIIIEVGSEDRVCIHRHTTAMHRYRTGRRWGVGEDKYRGALPGFESTSSNRGCHAPRHQ